MAITPLPPAPSRDDPANFATEADAFLGALPTFATEANALAVAVDADATAAAASASAASSSASSASSSASSASSSASSASSSATAAAASATAAAASFDSFDDRYLGAKSSDPSVDNDGNALIVGALYFNSSVGEMRAWSGSAWAAAYLPAGSYATLTGTQTLTNKTIAYGSNTLSGVQPTLVSGTSIKTINGTSLLGSGDITAGSSLVRSARTSNTILGVADKGTLIDITSGTFTQTFTACATLASGWFCYIRNSGTGDITLDPNASETIDGLTSFIMYPGETRIIQCDGSALRSIVIDGFYRAFTSSGTFVKPPGYSGFNILAWGAGGGGGKSTNTTYQGGGGGGGACVPALLRNSSMTDGTSYTVTIGAGGSAGTAGSGSAGGDTTLGSIVTAYGGGGGGGNSAANHWGGGGGGTLSAGQTGSATIGYGGSPETGTSGTNTNVGFGGGSGNGSASAYGGGGGGQNNANAGGKSFYGGGGGGGAAGTSSSSGGTSVYGGNGGAASATGTATVGTQPGGGGGGTQTGTAGAGGAGELRIWGIV